MPGMARELGAGLYCAGLDDGGGHPPHNTGANSIGHAPHGRARSFLRSSPIAYAKELISQMDHTSWTARDGAPQAVTALAQAPDGTLWIGTEGGLFSFDGITFTAFQSPPGQPQLPAGAIRSVAVSRDGAVWVGMHVLGMARIANGRVDLSDTADGDRFAQVKDLQQAPDGTIWCRAWNVLLRFGEDRVWHQDRAAEQIVGGSTLRRFFIGSTGTQWLAWPGHVYRRPSDQTQFVAVPIDVGIAELGKPWRVRTIRNFQTTALATRAIATEIK
jgi:hypothetical protein